MTTDNKSILVNALIYGSLLIIGAGLGCLGYCKIGPAYLMDVGQLIIGAGLGHFLRGLTSASKLSIVPAIALAALVGVSMTGCDKMNLNPACAIKAAQKCAAELMQCQESPEEVENASP